MNFEPKYYGILKNFDFKNINKDNFEILIASGIFEQSESCLNYDDYKEMAIEFHNNTALCNWLYFNNKEYSLKKVVLNEMLYFRENYLNRWWEVEPVYYEIDEAITRAFLIDDKNKAINIAYNKYLEIIDDIRFYNLYKNNTEINNYESWFEYFEERVLENDNFESVEKYLRGINDFLPKKFQEEWNNYYSFLKISDYCEKNRNSILNITQKNMEKTPNNSTKNIDLAYQICLLEEIRNINNWEDLSATKKGKILKLMFGKDDGNIKDIYLLFNKPKSEISEKHLNDRQKAIDDVKNILG